MLLEIRFLFALILLCWAIPTGAAEPRIVGTPMRSAELRTLFPVIDEETGRRFIIADVQDYGPTGYLLKTDLATGQTEQLFNPPGVPQDDSFGALLTEDGHYFYAQGGRVLSCDLKTGQWQVWGRIDPDTSYYFAFIEGPDGRIWAAGYPKCSLNSINRRTGEIKRYGRMDDRESYIHTLAADGEGWIYCGIGNARRNLVAFHPVTGEKRELLPPEERTNGRVDVFSGTGGDAWATSGQQKYRLRHGRAESVPATGPAKKQYVARYLFVDRTFRDGARVDVYDLENREIQVAEPDGTLLRVPLEYRSGGTQIIGNTVTADGTAYLSGSHPMHLARVDLVTGTMQDFGPVPLIAGGSFTIMTAAPDGRIFGGQYAGGRLWVFDPTKPWHVPGMSTPLFGSENPAALARRFRSTNGSVRRILCPDVLYFQGDRHELRLEVDEPGEYYCNLLFLRSPQYGAVAVFCDGRELHRENLNAALESFTPVRSLGPLQLAEGEHRLEFRSVGAPGVFALASFDFSRVNQAARPEAEREENPRVLGRWQKEVGMPRGLLVHPDNRHILICGLAEYGRSGGDLAVYDLRDGSSRLLGLFKPGESGSTLLALLDGDVLVGTTIRTQGGGYVTANDPALYRLRWPEGKVVADVSFPGGHTVAALTLWKNFLAVLTQKTLYLLDPVTLDIMRRVDLSALGYITITRTAMLRSPDDRLFLIASRGLWELPDPQAEPVRLLESQDRITGGLGVYDRQLFYVLSHEIRAFPLTP